MIHDSSDQQGPRTSNSHKSMASDTKSSVVKVRPGNQDASSKGKVSGSVIRKKIETSSTRPDSKHAVTKYEVKSKTISSSSSKTTVKTTTTTTKVKGKREKKVYNLAGQKFDPPEEREPLRIFYESLSKQIPTSQMAEFWMMEHGLLSPERSRRAHEKKQRNLKQIRMGIPVKSSKTPSYRPESSQKPQLASKKVDIKAKKRIADDDSDSATILFLARREERRRQDTRINPLTL